MISYDVNEPDVTWKEYIKNYFNDMLISVLPKLAALQDTSREVVFLDKELEELALSIKTGGAANSEAENEAQEKTQDARQSSPSLVTDLLADVPLKGGGNICVLLHIEVQGASSKKDMNLRMYEYQQAIFRTYGRHAIGLLIATDKIKTKDALGAYVWEEFSDYTTLAYKFKVIKTYELDEDELLASENIFDLLQLVALRAFKSKNNEGKKLNYAKEFVTLFASKGYSFGERTKLRLFMEAVMRIRKEETALEYAEYLNSMEEEKKMLKPSILEQIVMQEIREERRAKAAEDAEDAKKEGKKEGKLEMIKNMVKEGISFPQITKFSGFTETELRGLLAAQ